MKYAKFKNKETIVDSIKFDSKKEADYYLSLKLQLKTGIVKEIILQPKYSYDIVYSANGRTYNRKAFYKADFLVVYADNTTAVIDVKGYQTDTFKRKKKIIEMLYGFEIILK